MVKRSSIPSSTIDRQAKRDPRIDDLLARFPELAEGGRPASKAALALIEQVASELSTAKAAAQHAETISARARQMAHDFNNLITVILSYSRLLERSFGEGDATREDLHEITEAGQRAQSLTQQLSLLGKRPGTHPATTRGRRD